MDNLVRSYDSATEGAGFTGVTAPTKLLPIAGSQPSARGRARRILTVVVAGIICGLLAALFSISAAALLFSAELSSHISVGIGMCLIGTIILSSVIALSSSYPGMVSLSQEITMVTLAVVASSIYATMSGVHGERDIVATIIVMVGLATSLTGLALFGLGVLRLGRLIRFIPYPVIGGFLAGMGWLIVFGAMTVILGETPSLGTVHTLLEPVMIAKWLPAVGFAWLVGGLSRHMGGSVVLPVAVVVALCLFHAIVWIMGLSLTTLQHEGWVFQPPQDGQIWTPFTGHPFEGVQWAVIWGEAPKLLAMVAVTATSVLFASSGIGLSLQRDVDLDQELRAAGAANLMAGFGGGAAGFQGLGLTLLGNHLGAPYRVVGLCVAVTCAVVLIYGASLLSYIPIPLFGGLLFWIGGSLLYDWLVTITSKVSRREYGIVLLIVLLIASVGLLEGLLVGVFAAAIFFVIEYSRVEIIKYAMTAENLHSSFEHGDETRRLLSHHGKHTLVLRLQGFVFFGSVHRLHKFVCARFEAGDAPKVHNLILDCRDVSGLDSSAVLGFEKIREMVHKSGGTLILTNLCPTIMHSFGFQENGLNCKMLLHHFDELDQALVWCEERILEGHNDRVEACREFCIREQFSRMFNHPDAFEIVTPYLERLELEPHATFIRQGAPSEAVFFIEQGQVSVQLETADGDLKRLRTLGPGTIVGEISFCLRRPRIASVVADTRTIMWSLHHSELTRLSGAEPTLSAAFQAYLSRIMAERLSQSNQLVHSLTH